VATVRVLLVDDDALVRAGLRLILSSADDLDVVGEADDGASAVAAVREHRPDVVLMDIRMPRTDGLTATETLLAGRDAPEVIVLTTFDADDHVVGAVAAGADGFLLKDTAPTEIVSAIRLVAGGEAMLSPSATRSLLRRVRAGAPDDRAAAATARIALLTVREREVAVCVGRGMSNAEIGAELHLSVPTVKAHVSRLLDKLAATNRVQIAMCVHDAGLV
jgi:DNA-binding NarL/FixJ family response regulator